VPKPLRDELGLAAGIELDVQAIDGHLEVVVPSSVRAEEGPHGVRFAADGDVQLGVEQIRSLLEGGRR